jgi:hypothetical protein
MIFCHASFCFLDGVGPTACDDVDVVGCWLDRPLYVGIHLYRYNDQATAMLRTWPLPFNSTESSTCYRILLNIIQIYSQVVIRVA